MTAQLDQRVPLPSFCRRRVWLVLKPTFLLMALAAAVGIVKWGNIPDWKSMFGDETVSSVSHVEVGISEQQQSENESALGAGIEERQQAPSSLTAEEQVVLHLRDAHPMLYSFEQEEIIESLVAIGEEAIPFLVDAIKAGSVDGVGLNSQQLQVLMKALGRNGTSALPFLRPLIEEDEYSTPQWYATTACRYMQDHETASEAVTVDWDNIESEARSMRFATLPYVDDSPETISRYIALLDSSDAFTIQYTARALPAFGTGLAPHVETLQRLVQNKQVEADAIKALWVSGNKEAQVTVCQRMDQYFHESSQPNALALQILSAEGCESLAVKYAGRLRVVYDEALEPKVKAQAMRLLADADPTFSPPRESLFRLMDKLKHHEREAVYYFFYRRKGITPIDILYAQRNVSLADLNRAEQLIADINSSDKDVVRRASAAYVNVDSYTHPLFMAMMRLPQGRRLYARYGIGAWLPAWIRLPAYEAFFIADPTVFYSDPSYPSGHLRELRRMRQQVLVEAPELIDDYDTLLTTVERYRQE